MGQRKLATVQADDLSKRPTARRKTGNSVLDATTTRRGEVIRAARRVSDNVTAQATQHLIGEIPTNRSIYNGFNGEQFTPAMTTKSRKKSAQPSLKIIPIGGVGEMGIGKNMTAIEYGDEIVIVDMGFLFPGDDYPGINYIIPDISYLIENKEKIKAVVITHGHLDHIGAFHHLIPQIPAPVFATEFTIKMLEKNMDEDDGDFVPEYHELVPENHEIQKLSENFSIELVRVNHSIPDSAAVVIRTPVGVVVSTGDWRFEDDPVDGKKFDLTRLSEIAAKEGVLLLMNESTNCEDAGTITEYGENEIKMSFDQVMQRYPNNRMIVSCFSSQIHRMQNIVNSAYEHGRKVAFAGFSMIQNVEIGLKTGQLKIPKDAVMTMEDLVKLPDSKICVICTGSQGEFNAVLNRMANGTHRHIKIKDSDVIVFSSNPIPGNEKHVVSTVDGLMREGSDVLQNRRVAHLELGPLHLSGHAKREDHVKLIDAVHPTYYLPNHGEFHMLVHNAELAEDCGIPRKNIFVCDAGDVVEFFHDGSAKKTGRIKINGGIMYDDAGAEVSEVVLKDRIHMSHEGIFTIVLTIQKGTGRLLSSPDIISRGFIYLRDSGDLIDDIRKYAKQKTARAYAGRHIDLEEFKKNLREEIAQILYDRTGRSPIVIPVVNEIGSVGRAEIRRAEEKRANNQKEFEAQEMARIRGGKISRKTFQNNSDNHAALRRAVAAKMARSSSAPTAHFSRKNLAKPAPRKTNNAADISFKKTPDGPNPMRMWREK